MVLGDDGYLSEIIDIRSDILREAQNALEIKESTYSSHATKNLAYKRKTNKKKEELILRPPFFRDADRIIHSKAYSRYIDKTQLFYLVDNDHITHRVLHVQLVSKIGRTIGRALRLNEDLIEAIALGHDIGHVPYGHLGEKILSNLCQKHGIGKFMHNIQSIQFLDEIEECDLTLQVLDGILCHNGEITDKILKPLEYPDDHVWDHFKSKIDKIKNGKNELPLTIEGCVVRASDSIAYLGRDLKDAIEVNLISKELDDLLPKSCKNLFENYPEKDINNAIIGTLVRDIINNSYEKDSISFSEDVFKCVCDCKKFFVKYIYENPKLVKEKGKIKYMYSTVFENYLEDLEKRNTESLIYRDFKNLDWVSPNYLRKASDEEVVRDYIAGMTDRYFESVFKIKTIPERVNIRFE